jgi:hypothetical protein
MGNYAAEETAQLLILAEGKAFKNTGVRALKSAIKNENLYKNGDLFRAVKGTVKVYYGDLDRISFTTLRYGFIQAAGISTPYQIHSGQLMPAREPKDWISKALGNPTKDLADFIAKTNANAVVQILDFKI